MFYIYRIHKGQVIMTFDIETEGYAEMLAQDYREDYPDELVLVAEFDNENEAIKHGRQLTDAYAVGQQSLFSNN